jgi:hypothetical protein
MLACVVVAPKVRAVAALSTAEDGQVDYVDAAAASRHRVASLAEGLDLVAVVPEEGEAA